MRAVIASLRFNPGHLSHLIANARLLQTVGYAVSFRWHPQFFGMAGGGLDSTPWTRAQVLKLGAGSVYALWFPSVVGFLDSLLLRLLQRLKPMARPTHKAHSNPSMRVLVAAITAMWGRPQ